MTTPRSPWSPEKVRARLPDPADEASASSAGRWQTVSQPIDPERLPAILEIRAGETAMLGVRWLLRAAGLAFLLLGGGAWILYRDRATTAELALAAFLLPGMLGGLALWIWLVHRRSPLRELLRVEPDTVRYEAGALHWDEPIPSYAGLALRRRRTQERSRRLHHASRTAAERALRFGEEVELWWIELVHENPSRTVVLWASDRPFAASDALDLVERLAQALRLPVLTTSAIRRVAERLNPRDARQRHGLPPAPEDLPFLARWVSKRVARRHGGRRDQDPR